MELRGVSFAYDPGRLVLHDVSFVAEPGQTVALVGHTGSGKTSIVNLVAKFIKFFLRVESCAEAILTKAGSEFVPIVWKAVLTLSSKASSPGDSGPGLSMPMTLASAHSHHINDLPL